MSLDAFRFPLLAFSKASQCWVDDSVESSLESCHLNHEGFWRTVELYDRILFSCEFHNYEPTNVAADHGKEQRLRNLSTAQQVQSILATHY